MTINYPIKNAYWARLDGRLVIVDAKDQIIPIETQQDIRDIANELNRLYLAATEKTVDIKFAQ